MTSVRIDNIEFEDRDDKIRFHLLKCFYFDVCTSEIEKIGDFSVEKERIEINAPEKKTKNKFQRILRDGFWNMKNKITGRESIYVSPDSGIPLIGNNAFGIVDRNTSLIEVKPITGCNLNCIFCSVDEGPKGKWVTDFVVDPDYLAYGVRELSEFKGCDVEAHIGTQGEPLLYGDLTGLIRKLSSIEKVKSVTMDTNGTLLTKEKIDLLSDAGLSRINLSLNAMDKQKANELSGGQINIGHVIDMAKYIPKKMELLIAPIWVPGINDEEIPKLIEFAKELDVRIGIQNFLNYKYGRNPVKQIGWERFRGQLEEWEKEYNKKLLFDEKDFGIEKTRKLPKPFSKGDTINAMAVCPGRLKNTMLAVSENRNITILNTTNKGKIKTRILRDKHNIYLGK